MEGSKTLFCSSKFSWSCGRISSKFTDNLGTRLQKCSPALLYIVVDQRRGRMKVKVPGSSLSHETVYLARGPLWLS